MKLSIMQISNILASFGKDNIVIKEELLDKIMINKQNGEEVSLKLYLKEQLITILEETLKEE